MFRSLVVTVALVAILAVPVAATQAADFASQSLGRGYWHMFIAYAIAWILVFGWAISIGRRLSDVERKLDG
ncbi:MAG: CcmD family protein [Gemmatimonadota bacterium]|jgi:CcmD family protein